MSPQRLFNTALDDFTAGQWALCIDGFSTYLRNFSRTDQGDDAQWYIGECYQQDGKFTEAVDAYNRVITNFPKGDRVPDAYYKRGMALSAMGQTDRARESFETLMKTYPDHDMARMAKQQVDRLEPRQAARLGLPRRPGARREGGTSPVTRRVAGSDGNINSIELHAQQPEYVEKEAATWVA